MPRDSSGNYTLPSGNPVVSGTTILATWANGTMPDIGTELTSSLDRSGRGGMLAPFKVLDGTVAAPGLSFQSETTTGPYRAGAGDLRISVLNSDRVKFLTTGMTIFAPVSGTSLTVNAVSAGIAIALADGTRSGALGFVAAGLQLGISSAHSLDLYTSGATRVTIAAGGAVSINTPTSGVPLTVNVTNDNIIASFIAGAMTASLIAGTTAGIQIGTSTNHPLSLYTNAITRLSITAAGAVTIANPTSGVGLTIAGGGLTVTGTITGSLTGNVTGNVTGSSGSTTGNAATATALQNSRTINGVGFDGTANITVTAAAGTLTGNTLAAGVVTSSLTTIGTLVGGSVPTSLITGLAAIATSGSASDLGSGTIPSARVTSVAIGCTINGVTIGYLSVPRSTTSTTFAIGDVGKCVAVSAAINIPISTFAAGDAISVYNDSAASVNITISAGTLRLAGTTTTGTRALAARGLCTLWFNVGGATPEVIASGSGLS